MIPRYYDDETDSYFQPDCQELNESEQRIDDAAECLTEIIEMLYSKEPLDLELLQDQLEDCAWHLKLGRSFTKEKLSGLPNIKRDQEKCQLFDFATGLVKDQYKLINQ